MVDDVKTAIIAILLGIIIILICFLSVPTDIDKNYIALENKINKIIKLEERRELTRKINKLLNKNKIWRESNEINLIE